MTYLMINPLAITGKPEKNIGSVMFGSRLRYVGGSLHSIQASKRARASSLLNGICITDNVKPITTKTIPTMRSILDMNFLFANVSIF